MANNFEQFARNSLQFRPSDIRLMLERVHSHVVKPRMSAEELLEVVQGLGYDSRGFRRPDRAGAADIELGALRVVRAMRRSCCWRC